MNKRNNNNYYSELLHHRSSCDNTNPSVTPIFQCSGFEVGSEMFYGRKNSPNAEELEDIFKNLDNANHALVVNSGMTTIFMCLNLLKPGAAVLLSCKIYGCTYKLFQQYCSQHQLILDILDLTNIDQLEITKKYDMCFFETPTNPFLSTIDIKKVSDKCKNNNANCIVVVDNTWATPIFQLPLKWGADISLYSGSKYFSGHSDLLCGVIAINDNNIYQKLLSLRFYGGLILQPFSAWLLRRSLQTFHLRLCRQRETTLNIIDVLKKYKWIKKIYYPKIDEKQLVGYGGIIFIDITDDALANFNRNFDKFKLFGSGTGMACVTSMVAQPYFGSHASLSEEEKDAMNITPNLIRLCFGLEEPVLLLKDLQNVFM